MRTMEDEVVFSVLLDQAIFDKLAHEVGRNLSSCMVLAELSKFLLELENLHLLVLCIQFLLLGRFLLLLLQELHVGQHVR